MLILEKEAKTYNNIPKENTIQGKDESIELYEKGRIAILKAKSIGNKKTNKEDLENVTSDILHEIKDEIAGRPTMGDYEER